MSFAGASSGCCWRSPRSAGRSTRTGRACTSTRRPPASSSCGVSVPAEYRKLGVRLWLKQANTRGELSSDQLERVEGAIQYARALQSGDARALFAIDLPSVSASERGEVLSQILSHLKASPDDSLGIALDACIAAWPGAFLPGTEGLVGLSQPIAASLAAEAEPERWLSRLRQLLNRLAIDRSPQRGFEPDGLAAHVIASSSRRGEPSWRLRQKLFENDDAWRALAEDIRCATAGRSPLETLDILRDWDRRLTKGLHTARFFELWLNSIDGSGRLATIVPDRVDDLRTLPDLRWWNHPRTPRGAPRRHPRRLRSVWLRWLPFPSRPCRCLQSWMRSDPSFAAAGLRSMTTDDPDLELVPIRGATQPTSSEDGHIALVGPLVEDRWRCVWRP